MCKFVANDRILRLSPPDPRISMLKGSPGGIAKGKNLCHKAQGLRIAINIEIRGCGGWFDVHLAFVDVMVCWFYLKVVAKFIPSTDGVVSLTSLEVHRTYGKSGR